jgi:hypothetical protein
VVGEQLDGVAALDELRQHHDRAAWSESADPKRGPEPVVRAGEGHPDVGEHQVGFLEVGHCDQ